MAANTFDPVAYKQTTRAQWQDAAEAWHTWGPTLEEWLGPATELMLDQARIAPGARVLDLAAGAGGQTIAAARRAGPSGGVLATDISPAILAYAGDAARAAGLANVEVREMDGERLDLDDASFDAVVSRLGLIYFPDQGRALREIHRVLRPGGHLSAIVYSTPDRNQFFSIPVSVIRGIAGLPAPAPGLPGPFSLGAPGVLEAAFAQAGFADVQVRPFDAPVRFPAAADCVRFERESFGALHAMLAEVSSAERERAWREIEAELRQFESSDGFSGPCELLIGSARRGSLMSRGACARRPSSWSARMSLPRIFLGSSGKQAKLLQAITHGLQGVADVEPWTTTFNPGRGTLDRLVELSQEVDFAAFVFAQDDWTTTDASESAQASPRDNVVFEAGLFGGALGIRRTFILHANGSKLPTDLLGLTSVRYDPACGPAEVRTINEKLRKAIEAEGHRAPVEGLWWQLSLTMRTEAEPSAVSLLSIARDRDGGLNVNGRSWQEDGMLSARYWSEAAKERRDPASIFYFWRGERPRDPDAPQLEGTGEIKVETTDRATGYWTTRSDRDDGLKARTAGVYLRADPADLAVLESGSPEARAGLIAQRLEEWKSAANAY